MEKVPLGIFKGTFCLSINRVITSTFINNIRCRLNNRSLVRIR